MPLAPALPPVIPTMSETTFPPDLLALASLNAGEGIRRMGGKPEAYRKQLRRFRERYNDMVDELQRLMTEQGLQPAADYCHALKGVTGNIGATALYEKVSELNARFKQGQSPDAAMLAAMRLLAQTVMQDIDSLAADPESIAFTPPMNPDQLGERLKRLADALEYDLGAAAPLLMELRDGAKGTPLAPRIAAIAAQVEVFAIDEALLQINDLQQHLTHGGVASHP